LPVGAVAVRRPYSEKALGEEPLAFLTRSSAPAVVPVRVVVALEALEVPSCR